MREEERGEEKKACRPLNSERIKDWTLECRGKRPTQEKRERKKRETVFTFLEPELCSDSPALAKLGQLQAVCPAGREKINLLRYLDSIVDCNRATCSQSVYAKIFI